MQKKKNSTQFTWIRIYILRNINIDIESADKMTYNWQMLFVEIHFKK